MAFASAEGGAGAGEATAALDRLYRQKADARHSYALRLQDGALRWDDAFLRGLATSAVLRCLAVAHYGRGRGDYVETEYPSF